jgi:hypothetical protein
MKMPAELHAHVKETLLKTLLVEPVPLIQHATARAVSVIAKLEIPKEPCQWPEVLTYIFQCCAAAAPQHREIGTFLLSTVADALVSSGTSLAPQYPVRSSLPLGSCFFLDAPPPPRGIVHC